MANEIRLTQSIVYENGKLKRQYTPGTLNIPQATKGVFNVAVTATTAEADLTISGISNPGLMVLQNLESSTTGKALNWGIKSSTNGLPDYWTLKPNQVAIVNFGSTADVVRYKAASAGTLQVDVIIFEA